MRFRDLVDPDRALAILLKLAVGLILLSVVLQLFVCMLRQISPATGFAMFCVFLVLSPVAYLLRRHRQGRQQRPGPRRGAERTPVLPHGHEEGR